MFVVLTCLKVREFECCLRLMVFSDFNVCGFYGLGCWGLRVSCFFWGCGF